MYAPHVLTQPARLHVQPEECLVLFLHHDIYTFKLAVLVNQTVHDLDKGHNKAGNDSGLLLGNINITIQTVNKAKQLHHTHHMDFIVY